MGGREAGGGEGEDLEGEDFGFDYQETGECEADHKDPVCEGAFG